MINAICDVVNNSLLIQGTNSVRMETSYTRRVAEIVHEFDNYRSKYSVDFCYSPKSDFKQEKKADALCGHVYEESMRWTNSA